MNKAGRLSGNQAVRQIVRLAERTDRQFSQTHKRREGGQADSETDRQASCRRNKGTNTQVDRLTFWLYFHNNFFHCIQMP